MGHRKRKIRYYNFLLIPDNEQKTRSVKIRAWVLRALMALIFVVVVLIIIGAASYWKVASLAIGYNGLQEAYQDSHDKTDAQYGQGHEQSHLDSLLSQSYYEFRGHLDIPPYLFFNENFSPESQSGYSSHPLRQREVS